MKIENLINAISRATQSIGYSFSSGPLALMSASVRELPALWLIPPILKESRGRSTRRDKYKVSMRLIMAPDANEQPGSVWRSLEGDAFALYGALSKDSALRNITGFKAEPCEKPATKNGGAALAVEFEAELFYFNENIA